MAQAARSSRTYLGAAQGALEAVLPGHEVKQFATIGQLLDSLSGKGVYDIAIVHEQFTQYGFEYNRAADRLSYGGGAVRLQVLTRDQMIRDMARSAAGNILDSDLPPSARLVDALELSRAVHKLLLPGKELPGDTIHDRALAFRANVDSILAFEQTKEVH